MRRTVLVPTIVAASRARHALLAASLTAMLALALALAAPVNAQKEETTSGAQAATRGNDTTGKQEQVVQGSGQQAEDETQAEEERTADPLEGQTATITADSIGPIAVAGCEAVAGETASITVADATDDATEDVFTDGEGVVFQFGEQDITIDAEEDETDLTKGFDADTEDITGEVVDSEGIVCDDSVDEQRAANANAAADDENTARTADELAALSCAELLVLFRAESGSAQQYGDAAAFADSEVRARVEVCLKKEIVDGPDGKLPKTGGVSLLALAVLGVVSAIAGLSVIRGGRR